MSKSPSTLRQALALIGFIVITFCAPLLGIFSKPDLWYDALNKPSWNPPGWIFEPVWSLLYLVMAVAAWLVWRRVGWGKALMFYFIQLALNAAWTPHGRRMDAAWTPHGRRSSLVRTNSAGRWQKSF